MFLSGKISNFLILEDINPKHLTQKTNQKEQSKINNNENRFYRVIIDDV